jgi:HAMP domain-containing protein
MTEAAQKLAAMKNGSEIEEMQRQTSQAELENKPEKSPMEIMQTEIQALNKNIAEMLKYTKEMTENTKRTMDGIGKLNPNLFAR